MSRWLHSKSHPNVFSVTNPQGRRSETLSEAAAFIYQCWVDFWQNHHTPPEDQIAAHLRQGLPTIHPTEFPDLETEHVISIFRKQRGSAGPDGWSGSELSHVPDAAIALFVKLAQRWEIAGRAPVQMRQARMATLPKPGKSQNGSISVQHTAFCRLDIEASRSWILSSSQSRTMGLSSFVSSHWLHRSSGINEPCVWGCGENHPGVFHLAWSCPLRPDPFDPPASILLSRQVMTRLWSKRSDIIS